ncbi:MAG: lytic transglycosylase domain-containing protein [Ruminococcaceae bacterium]|nr:lytic transglycosylase domain-containing protein [Oscillospiraceae bacterium]
MKSALPKRWLSATLCLFLIVCLLVSVVCLDEGSRAGRERLYYDSVLTAADAFDLSPALILAVIRTESDFYKNARSAAGAVGLMQLMPDTFSYLRDTFFEESLSSDAIWQPTVNIRYGAFYLSYLLKKFESLDVALAAYNAGEGRVALWLEDRSLSPDGRTLLRIPYAETENYVSQTKKYYRHYLKKFHLKEHI